MNSNQSQRITKTQIKEVIFMAAYYSYAYIYIIWNNMMMLIFQTELCKKIYIIRSAPPPFHGPPTCTHPFLHLYQEYSQSYIDIKRGKNQADNSKPIVKTVNRYKN